jgi:hypothetical protein
LVKLRLSRIIAVVALSAMGASCHRTPSSSEVSEKKARAERLAPLLVFEDSARRVRREARARESRLGPDPYRVVPIPAELGTTYAGVLRGEGALVLLDARFRELVRVPGPLGASGIALAKGRLVLASGELENRVSVYASADLGLVGSVELRDVEGVRAVGWGANRVYALDAENERVVSFRLDVSEGARADDEQRFATCRGAVDLTARDDSLRVTCLFDHALALYPLDSEGKPGKETRIVHDGPIWSSDVEKRGDDFLVALGGVEDHPLDRTIGSFGNVDSFVFVYRWRPGEKPQRLAAVNVSEAGVVTPKVVHIRKIEPLEIDVLGYGGERRVRLGFERGLGAAPTVRASAFPPGSASATFSSDGSSVIANPLLDAWVVSKGDETTVRAVTPEPTDSRARLGEALFFTELMAKIPRADGALSRFSCETCHFEGGVDGRTHHTGRGDVRATTKPLFGLLENRPYFSRALDPTLTKMVDNEFRVANAGGGADPWFTVDASEHPFLKQLGVKDEKLDAVELRRALMHFLAGFEHRPNPRTVGRTTFTPDEAEGAIVFRDRCERCHSARRFSDEPESRVDFAGWEARVFTGDLVWASSDFQKTGIEPYVSERGARVPSLRRILRKRPYFTNGSSLTLADALLRVRFLEKDTWHDPGHAPAESKSLDARERASLQAFVELL